MSPIQILSEEIASQIAAGEVIERPASVVKELLENSLDAGATRIEISVEAAGRQKIVVHDNGQGIGVDELALAVSRHATSKLRRAEDLFRVTSLGFRGEALPSIASVSRLTISSQPPNSEVGGRIRVEGGKMGVVEQVGLPPGTTVSVENLFYNVPARLKFLKTDRTERARIAELVGRYALGYPDVRLGLTLDGKVSHQTNGNGDRQEVFAGQYGHELARQMLLVHADYGDLNIEGMISPTSYTRSNRKEISFFVNGRWIQDPALTAAILQAYHTMLMTGRYPLAALFIEMSPEMVDVNVHPAKSEVRFKQKDQVFSAVQRAVRRALLAYNPVPGVAPGSLWRTEGSKGSENWRRDGPDYEDSGRESGVAFDEIRSEREEAPQPDLPKIGLPLLRLIGQVGAAYLVTEGPDGLYLIDQHAAHERVLFEQMMESRRSKPDSQTLLTPVQVTVTPAQSELLLIQVPHLVSLGFDVEPFGPNAFVLRSVPAVLAGLDPEAALRVLVEDFEEDETPLEREIEARITARICKRAAVKSGQILSETEQKALIEGLEKSNAPRTCPHGRPTMIHLSVDLLERQFGRRGAK